MISTISPRKSADRGVISITSNAPVVPSLTSRRGQRSPSFSSNSGSHRGPRYRTAISIYAFALVSVVAAFALLQQALVCCSHPSSTLSASTLLSSSAFSSLHLSQRRSRQTPPDNIFGPSPPAQPAVESHNMDRLRDRKHVGGLGDPKHLGGFAAFDTTSTSPAVWSWMIQTIGVKSVLDVGCGRGWSTSWFLYHGVDALCVEGSHDAVSQNAVTSPDHILEHDFTRGPWWPEKTYDVAWVAEFVQQVSLMHSPNYIPALRKAAVLFVSAPLDAGWHHVEVHRPEWWIERFERLGWKFEADWTSEARAVAAEEASAQRPSPDGSTYYPLVLIKTLMVFVNPEVARLPQHAHLFPEHGCFKSKNGKKYDGPIVQRECATGAGIKLETKLDISFLPLSIQSASERRWRKRVEKLMAVRKPQLPRGDATARVTSLDDDHEDFHVNNHIPLPPIDRSLNLTSHAISRITKEWKRTGNAAALPRIPVVIWPYLEFGFGNAETRQIEVDGVQESPFLILSENMDDFDPNVVWVADTGFAYGWNFWCSKLDELVVEAKQKRVKRGLPLQWPIIIVNFSDGPTHQRCYNVEDSVGIGMVKYTMRSFVDERDWNEERQWVDVGFVIDSVLDGMYYQHTPLNVRTDTIVALDKVLRERQLTLASPIENLDRPIDLTHFWPKVILGDGTDPVGEVASQLRTKVSQIISRMADQQEEYKIRGKGLAVYVGLSGKPLGPGRQRAAKEYIESLLRTKIIVITQRDEWEDHYRLFEGLVSGAMVLCDRMLSMPEGLKNGTHLIEFTSENDLIQKAMYYLEHDEERQGIARQGRHVAMARHRSWHRMEEIIFGQSLTLCQGSDGSACPYIVHANETRRIGGEGLVPRRARADTTKL